MAAVFEFGAEPCGGTEAEYVREILAWRAAQDQELRDRHFSPLALTHILRLQRETTTIGSAPDADLRLDGAAATYHAVVVRLDGVPTRFVLRPADGAVFDDAVPDRRLAEVPLNKGTRVRIGRFIVYFDDVATVGPVLRVLDFESRPYVEFDGLAWFPVDPAYRIEATVRRHPEPRPIRIIDTLGWESPGWAWGEARFELQGRTHNVTLVLFTPRPGANDLVYVIFKDATNGKETYPACRYVLLPFSEADRLVLDFNRALNPHCAYNTGFACPLPPPGNRLPVAIRVGEKNYPHRPAH